jgi:hypothetical protein
MEILNRCLFLLVYFNPLASDPLEPCPVPALLKTVLLNLQQMVIDNKIPQVSFII